MPEARPIRRVLMTADTVGGIWTFALELSRALSQDGIEVVLATMGGQPSKSQRADAACIPNLELVPSDYRLEWMEAPWEDVLLAGDWLLDLEARVAPDVIHLNSYAHGAIGWASPVVMTAHSCVLSWWRAVHGLDAPASWARYRSEVARGLSAAQIVTAPSRYMLRAIETHYGAVANGCVIPNGRCAEQFAPSPKEPFILTAGRLWDRAKNAALLESIGGELRWPVYLAGEQRHPDGGLETNQNCRALGRLSGGELQQWYARAPIYALPARYEPFGLSALEAALSGCALVLGDIPSLREIWQDAAIFISPDDASRWTSELNALAQDAGRQAELGQCALDRGLEFSPERMATAYASAYKEAVREREVACAS
jgi:glycosyltransferase involved in cell wall biosynthesis